MSKEKFFDCIFNKLPSKNASFHECMDIKNNFIPEKLYKYTKAKYAEELLVKNLIYLPTIDELNDLYEARVFLNNKKIRDELNKNVNLNRFSKNMGDNVISELLSNFSDDISKDYSQEFSVICLSENNCINPMWGNYADKYRGICLEYNLKDTKEKYFRDFCFPIKYVKREADFEQIKSNESFVLNNIPFEPLLKKSFDWNYEEEWRIIIHKPSLKEIINETKIDDKIKEHLLV